MGSPNPFVSNGTCYTGRDRPADSSFFPCGNAALGHKTCCQAGDMCLSSRACYNGRFGLTYLAGCSDTEYADGSCPDKMAWDDQPWAGLVYCNGTSEQWYACEQSGRQQTLTSADACWCPSTSRTVAFTDASILTNVVQLPTASGGSVIWQPGYVPTPTPTSGTSISSTTSPSGIPSNTGTSTPGPTSDPPPTDSGLSSAQRIGIGVGVGVGGAILLAILGFFLFGRRRRKADPDMPELDSSRPKEGHSPATPATTTVSELEPRAARPWSTRSELPGTDTPLSMAEIASARGSGTDSKIQDRIHPSTKGSPKIDTTPPSGKGHGDGPVAELPG